MKDRQKSSGSGNNFWWLSHWLCGKLSGRISIEKLGGKLASCLGKSPTGALCPVLLQSLTTLCTLPDLCNTCAPTTTLIAALHPFHDPHPSTFYPACVASSHTLILAIRLGHPFAPWLICIMPVAHPFPLSLILPHDASFHLIKGYNRHESFRWDGWMDGYKFSPWMVHVFPWLYHLEIVHDTFVLCFRPMPLSPFSQKHHLIWVGGKRILQRWTTLFCI